METIPGIETADYEVAQVEHSVGALTELFKGAKVVCNMVGPFITYGPVCAEVSAVDTLLRVRPIACESCDSVASLVST